MRVVTTFHPPSSVVRSLKCSLAEEQEHLVVAKANRLEVFSLRPEGLRRECSLEIWGRIVSLAAIPLDDSKQSNLLVLTDHPDPKLIILTYVVDNSGNSSIVSKEFVDLYDRYARPAEFVTDVAVDPTGQVAVVSCYTGRLKVVQFEDGKQTGVPFDISIPELFLLAMTFMRTDADAYTLGILHYDHQQRLQLLSRDIDIADLSAPQSYHLPPTILSTSVFPTATTVETPPLLIPVPPYASQEADEDSTAGSHLGGVLIVGGRKVLFFEHASEERQEAKKGKQRRASKRMSSGDPSEAAKAREKEKERESRKVKQKASVKWPWSEITAWCPLDDDGRRFLLGDAYGRLAMLAFDETPGLVLIPVGETSPATTLSYLASQVVYVGSHFGDSQLLRIHPTPIANVDSETLHIPLGISRVLPSALSPSNKGKQRADFDIDSGGEGKGGKVVEVKGTYIEVLDEYQNIAPIMDAALADLDGSGQPQIITCSGGRNTGSLKVVRTGADFQERAVVQGVPHVVDMWPLRTRFEDTTDTHLVTSTLTETCVWRIDGVDVITRLDPSHDGLIATSPTLAISNIPRRVANNNGGRVTSSYKDSSLVVQITPEKVHLVKYDAALGLFASSGKDWDAKQQGRSIVAASINASQFVIGLSGGRLTLLNLGENDEFQVLKSRDFSDVAHGPLEISAISCHPFDTSKKFATYIAVSFWGTNRVAILSLESASSYLNTLCETDSLSSLPRSLLLYNFGSGRTRKDVDFQPHLLAGLADGTVVSFIFKDNDLKDKKVFALGNAPVALTTCTADGKTSIFASGSRASVLYWDRQRLHQSPVMLKDMARGASLNSAAFPSCLVLATSSSLTIGNVRGVDKMQIRTVPLGLDNPRRVAYHAGLKTLGVACTRAAPPRIAEAEERLSSFKLFDDVTFTNLASFYCDPDEEVASVLALPTAGASDKPSFCVGTVRIHPDEREPSKGRLLLFSFSPQQDTVSAINPALILVASATVDGCVYQAAYVHGLIVAAVNSSVIVFRTEIVNGSSMSFHKIGEWNHNYTVTSLVAQDDVVIVGDAICSISMLRIGEGRPSTIARDYSPLWPVAIEAIGKDAVIGANSDCNLFSFALQRDPRPTVDRQRNTLERDGGYYLGDVVNKFLPGGLAMADFSGDAPIKPLHLFFTSTGRIGVILNMADHIALQMTALQRNMAKSIIGPGDVHHPRWRAPANNKGHSDAEPAFGFLDGDFVEQYLTLRDTASFLSGESEAERVTMPHAQITAVLERLQSLH
ncbi:hypothetical protein POSPLADRAFT_1048255 [Postia placenta MAD-698-R-SB12]|uniref:DNA damage-binding protein 1 n=1 Tax=Postia placenta MAD-698-R-SB12 TaxID=670580 RepID=A0A1X6MU49_9APHY|nr:hypothetical protein POSPLADRAFT_1048255 [Postia placenta MAD-698-R-SB12]OSX59780.1 hypothetical protein POSPLADRAFT_1048255 [Postia placenta MAD-698-R-SB12]